jgi:hypothetical protein
VYMIAIVSIHVFCHMHALGPPWLRGIGISLAPSHKMVVGGSLGSHHRASCLEWLLGVIIVDPSVGHSSHTAATGPDRLIVR